LEYDYVVNMKHMFNAAYSFDGNISRWNVTTAMIGYGGHYSQTFHDMFIYANVWQAKYTNYGHWPTAQNNPVCEGQRRNTSGHSVVYSNGAEDGPPMKRVAGS